MKLFDSLMNVVILAKIALKKYDELIITGKNQFIAVQFYNVAFIKPLFLETFIFIENFLRQVYKTLNPPNSNQGFTSFDTVYKGVINSVILDSQKQTDYKEWIRLYKTARNCMHTSFICNEKNKFNYKEHNIVFQPGNRPGININNFLESFLIDIANLLKDIILSDKFINLTFKFFVLEQQIAETNKGDYLFFTN